VIELIATSPAMRDLLQAALDVAPTATTVLITGESGSGKEVLARVIHHTSPRSALPFTLMPCAAFSVAEAAQALQHGGTVLFDELSALGLEAQAQLLSVLEPPHSSRVITSSNRDLGALVERGGLRSDLYYRLDVYPLAVPALRDRTEDIGPLADRMLTRAAVGLGRTQPHLTGAALAALESLPWPGNVRELSNVLERAVIRSRSDVIDLEDLGLETPRNSWTMFPDGLPLDLAQLERLAVAEALRRTGGNRTHAARLLHIGLRTLRQKLNGPPRADVMDQALDQAPGDVP
jgi:DNA-binding NtrC family response regulator